MKKILLPFFILCWQFSFGQITFQKMYWGAQEAGYPENYSVQQTSDSGYMIGGSTGNYESAMYFYLLKTDKYGDTLWTKKYGNADEINQGFSAQQTLEGGYIIVGENETSLDSIVICLIKTNSTGDTLWTKDYAAGTWGIPYTVQQTNDSGYIIVCTLFSISNTADVSLIKTDVNGNIIWTKTYGGADVDEGFSVQQTKDNGYIVIGETNSFGSNDAVYVIKTDASGNMSWSKTFFNYFSFFNIQQTNDGGYIVLTNNGFAVLTKMDSIGNNLWMKNYTFNSHRVTPESSMKQTTDSGYILTGIIYDSATDIPHIYLQKTNANGDIIWNRTFGDSGYPKDVYSLQQTNDGGYVILGTEGSNIYFIKTDADGNNGCNNKDIAMSTFSFVDSAISPSTVQSSQSLAIGSNTFSVSSGAGLVTTVCFTTGINEIKEHDLITLYPNPATNQLTIHTSFHNNEAITVSIMNVLGQDVSTPLNVRWSLSEVEVDVSKLSSGIYFVQITGEKERWVGKFIKE